MATVNKDFKIKSGLIVEGTTATVNGFDVLTKKQADQDYVVNLIGGTATSANEANKVVKRDANGNFAAGTITADLTGDVTGQVSDISNHDTGDLAEGSNLYFTNQRALDATNAAYDAAGSATTAANAVASDLTDHENATVAHGATGAVVGTTNTQTLTNKTIGDTLNFTGAGAMTINSDSHIVLTPAAGSSVKWGADVLATQGYADQAEADAISTASADATSKANTAEADANTYTDGKIATEVTDRNSAITSAINTEVTNRNSAIATAKGQAIADANSYTDGKVADLVDSAPELLDTLNELAAAIADNPNYATDAAAAVAGRVAKSGDTMTGDLVLPGAPTLTLHAATKGYVDGEISTLDAAAQGYANTAEDDAKAYTDTREGLITTAYQSYADTAEQDAKDYADDLINDASSSSAEVWSAYKTGTEIGLAQQAAIDHADALDTDDIEEGSANLYFTNQRAIDAVGGTIGDAIDELNTDDIEEGSTNLYFTDARAKTSAADLLVGATKTNITITGNGSGLTITAENGVADSDTDDLVEGTTNKYFTDVRAVDALEAVVPNFTAVELNSVAKQVAATLSAPTAGIQVAHAFAKADYRSAEYLVKVAYGTHTEISKVLLTLDSSDNIAITEYGIVGTNGSASSISAGISGANVQLQVTTANNDSTVTVMGTLLV
jgi:hypothetical protein